MIERISNALEANGFTTSCLLRDKEEWGQKKFSSQELMKIAFEEIISSDLLVVDLSEKGVGLGIEAGYAFAEEIPIITIAKEGSDISKTLQGISKEIFIYKTPEQLVDFFKQVELGG